MAQTQVKRYPGRAAFWGLLLGAGVAVYLTFVWPVIGLDSPVAAATKMAVVAVAVMAVSLLWGLFGPARKPKGPVPAYFNEAPPPAPMEDLPPPAPIEDEPPPTPEASGTDEAPPAL